MVEEKGPNFIIKDKRHFKSEGESADQEERTQEDSSADPRPDPGEKTGERAEGQAPLPELNFATLVFSLSSSALVHLGKVPDPATGEPRPDLPLAKQTIDLLALLQEKTKGNLEEEEDKLLVGILYDLRMTYVQAVKDGPQAGS